MILYYTIFGSDAEFSGDLIMIPIWTRYNCYVLSSLAVDDVNNFLGHTRPQSYMPLKYYRLSSKVKRFWIELYENRYHDVPVALPVERIILTMIQMNQKVKPISDI